MASVRMTNTLRNDIFRAAEEAYKTANPQPVPSTEFVDTVKQTIEMSLPNRSHRQFILDAQKNGLASRPFQENNLPALREIEQIRLIDRVQPNEERECEIRFTTPMEIASIAYRTSNFSWDTPRFHVQDLDLAYQTEVSKHLESFNERWAEHRQATADYRASIRDLLDKCTTLKQLLEIWPAAESLVPQNAIQKLHEKVTRKARAEQIKEEINFDPTIANQAVLTSKMLGV